MIKTCSLILVTMVLSVSLAHGGGTFPTTLAGFTLGQDFDDFSQHCDMDRASPIPDAPYLTEVHLKSDSIPGIRGGSLTFANAEAEGKLVRIKLKFHNRSQKFFDQLLRRYENAFGKPDSYEGDAFRNVIAWKWNFSRGKERVSVLLMWSRESEMRPGVSIKMTLDSLVDSEYKAFMREFNRREARNGGPTRIKSLDEFLPR
ncbi:hypothetical protein GM415_02785 [Pseudodesulfovibrio cashew]|uniref:Uncharacterized protein n=1 Tax=Pseudodesulfovibrio cashew TaxID=2678688 RepID=A0A6I6JES7_9BACT|nr:hypothetical protein [Pseudodesulfovibrio cashew]QGY39093.1 hypothetical protein GM415_02785 [Pseudodesulfovibrio cashew]